MTPRWIIAAAIVASFAATTGWQVIAQEPAAANAPADTAEPTTKTNSPPTVQEVIKDHQGRNAESVEKDPAAIERALKDSEGITVMMGTRNILLPLVENKDLLRLAQDIVEATKDDPRITIFHFPNDSLLIKAEEHKAMAIAAFLLEVLRADYKGPPRPQAQPKLPLREIGEVEARTLTDLEAEFKRLDKQAAKTARELRELQTADGWRRPGVAHQLRSVLRSTVEGLFEIRQQLQRRELAEYQSRLTRIGQQIEDRVSLKDAIIDRRVEELINPALAWEPKEAADSSPKKIGGGAAPPEPVVPKDAGAQPPGGEQPKSKFSLREQFVTRFPETVAPEVLGPHRGTFIDEFVDISPDGELVTTVRPVDEEDSYACALWDRETGRRVAETVRRGKPVVVRFSANGEYVGVATFWTNQFEVFKVPTGEFVQTVDHEPRTSWEAAFNRFAEVHAGQGRDRGGASKLNVEGTVLSVDNQRELGIISMGSEDGMRPGTVLRVHHGPTYLGRVTVVETNEDTSLVRIEEENSAMPIRRGDRVTGAPPTVAEVGAARMTAGALAWDILGTKLGERPAIGQYQGGLTIQELRSDGPAAQAKLNVYDVLVGLGSWETPSLADLCFALEDPDVRPQPGQTKDVKALVVRDGKTISATITIAAPKDGDGAATPPAPETEEFAVRGSVHVLIQSPRGAAILWTPRTADGRSQFRGPPGLTFGGARKTIPASFVVAHGQRVPFHLWDMPGREHLRLFGSLEIAPLTEAIFPFVASSAIPIEITEENLNRAWSGEEVVKLIWVSVENELRVVDYPSLECGADPVDEARRRGVELHRDQVLVILRLSRRYRSIGANEEQGPQMELLQPPKRGVREKPPIGRGLSTEQVKIVFTGHADRVTGVAFSADGKLVASSSRDQTVKVWDVASGEETLTLKRDSSSPYVTGHAGYVQDVAFRSDGKVLASAGSGDKTVCLWSVASGRCVRAHSRDSNFMSVAFSPNGELLAAADDKSIRVWDNSLDDPAGSDEILSLDADMPLCVEFSPNGERLAAVGRDHSLRIWSTHTGEAQLTAKHTDQLTCVAFSPDGHRLATASAIGVNVWDASSGAMLIALPAPGGVSGVGYSPDGTRLASAGPGEFVKLWDATTGKEVLTLQGHRNRVTSVAFSPDGAWLASGSEDRTVRVWNVSVPVTSPPESNQASPEAPAPHSVKDILKSAIANAKWRQAFSMKVNSKQEGERQLVSESLIRKAGSKIDLRWTTERAGQPKDDSSFQSHRSIDNGAAWITRTTPAGGRNRSGGLTVADRQEQAARAFASWTFGFALDGHLPGNGSKTLFDILSEAPDLVAKEDTVDRVRCLYVAGSTEYGDVAVWLDPANNYALRQAIVVKERGNLYDDSRMGEHPDTVGLESVGFVVSKMAYTNIDGYSIPTSGAVEFTQTRDGKAPERWSITYTRSEIELDPDLTGSDAFTMDFENGARISDWDAQGRETHFLFRDGKLIPQEEPDRAIDLEDVHFYRAPARLPEPLSQIEIDPTYFAGDFEIVDVAFFEPDEFEVPGPRPRVVAEETLVWTLQAKRDLPRNKIHHLLANPFPRVKFYKQDDGADVVADGRPTGYGLYHDGRWLGDSGPTLTKGERIRVWTHLGAEGSAALIRRQATRVGFEKPNA